MKICLDPGHGGSSAGAAGIYSFEKDIALKLAMKLRDKLEENEISTILTRDTDNQLDLRERCDIANKGGCDVFLSIHCNGYSDTSESGTETYYKSRSRESEELAQVIQSAAVKYNTNRDRGVKEADFYVLKNTNMTAVLHQVAFITNAAEESMLNNDEWQEGFIKSVGEAIIRYAEVIRAELRDGSKHPISGVSEAAVKQMESFVHKENPEAPYLAQKYLAMGREENIRGDMAYAQAVLETEYFRFTGVVKPEQNNFCSMGVTGPGRTGAYFPSVDYGIKAHIQHLKAYANKEPMNSMPIVDPRFHLINRGTAPDWEDLDGKWEASGEGYGELIVEILRKILSEPLQVNE